jgi:hypothetical protein
MAAWRVRHALGMDKGAAGPTDKHNDAIVYDVGPKRKSKSGFGHPACGHTAGGGADRRQRRWRRAPEMRLSCNQPMTRNSRKFRNISA